MAQAAQMIRALAKDIDPDELREQLGEAMDDPDVKAQLLAHPHSMIVGAGSRLLTATALRTSWQLVVTTGGIIGGLLGLAYINFHYIMRHFAQRKGFTPLGSEWKIWRTVLGWPGFALKYVELIALVFLDTLVLLIILTAIVIIGFIAWAIANPCEFLALVGQPTAAIVGGALLGPLGGGAALVGSGACVLAG